MSPVQGENKTRKFENSELKTWKDYFLLGVLNVNKLLHKYFKR